MEKPLGLPVEPAGEEESVSHLLARGQLQGRSWMLILSLRSAGDGAAGSPPESFLKRERGHSERTRLHPKTDILEHQVMMEVAVHVAFAVHGVSSLPAVQCPSIEAGHARWYWGSVSKGPRP